MMKGPLYRALSSPIMENNNNENENENLVMHEEDVKHLLVIMGTITVISFVIVVTMLALAVVFIW